MESLEIPFRRGFCVMRMTVVMVVMRMGTLLMGMLIFMM